MTHYVNSIYGGFVGERTLLPYYSLLLEVDLVGSYMLDSMYGDFVGV